MVTNLQITTLQHYGSKQEAQAQTRRLAIKLFNRVYGKGLRSQLRAKLTGKANELKTLSRQPKSANSSKGTVVVSLSKIVGTEGRSKDFDRDFHPLKKHNRERWINIAVARDQGVTLPAVELVQVGDAYYVRDGHHRVSVAKALGQLEIDARIVN
jgi:hypothetical protein